MNPNRNDLCGWQLNNPDQDMFDVKIMEVFGECRNCELTVECAVPSESLRCLVPKEGRIIGLGHEKESGKPRISYFALLNQRGVKFILLNTPDHSWATASYISRAQVPAWALSQLDSNEGVSAI